MNKKLIISASICLAITILAILANIFVINPVNIREILDNKILRLSIK